MGLAHLYVSLMPVILTGIFTMAWMKMPFLNQLRIPLDFGHICRDGRALFGDHKTWKGLLGYAFFGGFSGFLWGSLCRLPTLTELNLAYARHENTLAYNLVLGVAFGLAYAVFELPNSFLKRRFNIAPGESSQGLTRFFFTVLDQIDSLIGCLLVLNFVAPVTPADWFGGLAVGALTHMFLNVCLRLLRLRDTWI